MQRVTRYLSVLATLAVMFGVAVAAEPEPTPEPATVVVQGAGDAEVTVSLDQGTLTVTSTENGKKSTQIVDLEAVGLLAADAVDEALVGVGDVFAGLQDLQLQCRLGQDNRLNLSCHDTEFELDLDQMMAQVASAVQTGLQEIDASEWTSQHNRWDEVSDEELRDELADLKTEMESLRAELQRLQEKKE